MEQHDVMTVVDSNRYLKRRIPKKIGNIHDPVRDNIMLLTEILCENEVSLL